MLIKYVYTPTKSLKLLKLSSILKSTTSFIAYNHDGFVYLSITHMHTHTHMYAYIQSK